MPRLSYEEHRARKRRGSVVESETDAESLASFTTLQSSTTTTTSYRPPIYNAYASSSRLSVPKPRTMSSASYSSSPSSPNLASADQAATVARREARRKQREEREKRSTLLAERYDSPLRRVVRWCAKDERKGQYSAALFFLTLVSKAAMAYLHPRYEPLLFRKIFEFLASRSMALQPLGHIKEDTLYLLEISVRVLAETWSWIHVTDAWARDECKRDGRSWRTRVLAQTTMVLAPTFLLPTHLHTLAQVAIPHALDVIASRRENADPTRFTHPSQMIVAPILILCNPSYAVLIPASVSFAVGISTRLVMAAPRGWRAATGGERMSKLYHTLRHIAELALPLYQPQSNAKTASRWLGYDGAWARYRSALPSFDLNRLDCVSSAPNIWCASDVAIHWASWMPGRAFAVMSAIATICALLPSILIPLYIGFKVKSGAKGLFTTALFTSSLGLLLFLPQSNAADLVFVLLPLSMMTSMRGGKDDMGETDEGWEMGVLVQNTVAFTLLPRWKAQGLALPAIVFTILWNWIIGYNPRKLPLATRTNTMAVYGVIVAVCSFELFYSAPSQYPALWSTVRQLVGFAVFETAWIWGLTKLYLQAWSLAGPGMGIKVD